jgi:shikimate dehydrogenase
MHNAAFEAMAVDARYEAWEVPAADIPATIEKLRQPDALGMQVTVPHKQAVMPLLDSVDATASAIGAVNTVIKRDGALTGTNTDKYGFIRSLTEAGCEPAGMKVLVLGVGGTERAVTCGLVEAGASFIVLAGRRRERVEQAATQLRSTAPRSMRVSGLLWDPEDLSEACSEADLVVNCTPVGMRHTAEEEESPLDGRSLRPGAWVSDVVYNPLETKLLRLAREAGARTVGGLDMLVYQAAAAIELWTGRAAPIDIMRSAALTALNERK